MYYVLRLINIFLTLIPRKIALTLGRFLGFLIYSFNPVRKKIAEKKAKRQAKEGPKKEVEKEKPLDVTKPLSLDFLTNPDKE